MSGKALSGRTALVTGGARGIGASIALALADAGASVMIGGILQDLGRETAAQVGKSGNKTAFVKLDVTQDSDWEIAAAATVGGAYIGTKTREDQLRIVAGTFLTPTVQLQGMAGTDVHASAGFKEAFVGQLRLLKLI